MKTFKCAWLVDWCYRKPGFWENHITEELIEDGPNAKRTMHSMGRMFGLTFWENWYVIGENSGEEGLPPFKFVYYTGHTLQGNYEGESVWLLCVMEDVMVIIMI